MKNIIRIKNYYIRGFLVCLVLPFNMLIFLILKNIHVKSRRKRMMEKDFWKFNYSVFLAMVDGQFVDYYIDA